MDYKFYQGLVMHQAGKGEKPQAGFNEFMRSLKAEVVLGEAAQARMTKLHGILFPGGGISNGTLGLLELLDPEKMILTGQLVAWQRFFEEKGDLDDEAALLAQLKELEVPDEKVAEVRKLLSETGKDTLRAAEFEEKTQAILKKMYVEQAEIFKKYIGLFEEAFNEKS